MRAILKLLHIGKQSTRIPDVTVVPTWHWYPTFVTQVVLVMATLMTLVCLAALANIADEAAILKEQRDDALLKQWELEARIISSQEQGCFTQQFVMPVDKMKR